jgi:hypothetical protein
MSCALSETDARSPDLSQATAQAIALPDRFTCIVPHNESGDGAFQRIGGKCPESGDTSRPARARVQARFYPAPSLPHCPCASPIRQRDRFHSLIWVFLALDVRFPRFAQQLLAPRRVMVATEQRVALTCVTSAHRCRLSRCIALGGRALGKAPPSTPRPRPSTSRRPPPLCRKLGPPEAQQRAELSGPYLHDALGVAERGGRLRGP